MSFDKNVTLIFKERQYSIPTGFLRCFELFRNMCEDCGIKEEAVTVNYESYLFDIAMNLLLRQKYKLPPHIKSWKDLFILKDRVKEFCKYAGCSFSVAAFFSQFETFVNYLATTLGHLPKEESEKTIEGWKEKQRDAKRSAELFLLTNKIESNVKNGSYEVEIYASIIDPFQNSLIEQGVYESLPD